MKIIQIMPEFGLAGAETMCENLTYELIKKGQDVLIISLYDYHSAITERLEKEGVKIEYLSKKPGLDFSIISKIKKILKRENPDVIHTHRYVMQYAIPAALLTRIPVRVHTVHNVAQKENDRMARIVAKVFYKYCHVIPVALSDEIKLTILDEYSLPSEKVPVILNGIDLSKCIPKTSYEISDKIKILHIGRFSEQKNHKGLIQAFKLFHERYSDSELLLIGEGDLLCSIERLVKDNQLQESVKFLGLKKNVYTYLHDADIFILPSIYEGMPMTLIEAMGTGLPIIATKVGGVPDMINNAENGMLCNLDTMSIFEQLCTLLEKQELRKHCGMAALKTANNYSSEKMAEKYLTIYRDRRYKRGCSK